MNSVASDPWETFSHTHRRGERVTLTISRVVGDIGLFLDLDGGIDGIVHLGDIDWRVPGEQAIGRYSVGDSVEVVVLAIEVERQRVSLGIKQLVIDPRSNPSGDPDAPAEIVPTKPKPSPLPLTEARKS